MQQGLWSNTRHETQYLNLNTHETVFKSMYTTQEFLTLIYINDAWQFK